MMVKSGKLCGIIMTVILLVSLILVASPASALNQPQVTITPPGAIISAVSHYFIVFTTGKVVPAGDSIVLEFPAMTNITGLTESNVAIQALSGIGGGPIPADTVPDAVEISGTYPDGQVMTITIPSGGNGIGAGSLVGIGVDGVVNPAVPGTYSVSVGTQTSTGVTIESAVASLPYSINAPYIIPLPGVVLSYNSAGVLLSQSNSINTGIMTAGLGGRVEVGPGTYDEDVVAQMSGQTIIGTGDPGTAVINDANTNGIGGTVTITNPSVTLDNILISPSPVVPRATMVYVSADADNVSVKNCVVNSGTAAAIAAASGTANMTVSGCYINVGNGETGVVSGNGAKIYNCMFTGEGPGGMGIYSPDHGTMIINNTFEQLDKAVMIEDNHYNVITMNRAIMCNYGIHLVNSDNNILFNNTLADNTFHGIYLTDSSSDNVLSNNTMTSNDGYGLYIGVGCLNNSVSNSILWNNGIDLDGGTATYSDISDGDAGEGNISEDPLFVNPANHDYHLHYSSPCVDAGNNADTVDLLGLPMVDPDGDPRICDGDLDGTATVDMGADEYIPDPYVSPIETVDFHGVELGSSLDLNITLYNTGNSVLTVNTVTRISGSGEFTYIGPAVPFDIPLLGSHIITIRYTPAAEAPANAAFNVNTSDPFHPDITFDMTGYGVILLSHSGDVDGNGEVNVLDMTEIARIILGLE
jgi:parallel beta-helix repeat protein